MDQDGANVQRLTDGGYAISPSWAPNGQFLTFAWNRKYGPGAPGGQDIYVMDIASRRWAAAHPRRGQQRLPLLVARQSAHRLRAPVGGHTQIWTMLVDGTEQQQLTTCGQNFMPNWSWK